MKTKHAIIFGILISLTGLTAAQGLLDNQTNDTVNETMNDTSNNLTSANTSATTDEGTINQSVETMILASTENYPDALVAAPAAERYGMPVILTEEDELSGSAESLIEDANTSNIVIIGGPAVISEEVEETVDEHANTTRIWGVSQYDTSAKVSSFFWSESEEATLVHYSPYEENKSYQLVAAAKERATLDEEPLFLATGGNLSNSTRTAMEDLGIQQVDVYSTSDSDITDDLGDAGVEANVETGSLNDLVGTIQQNMTFGDDEPVHIVAASSFQDVIAVPAYPSGPSVAIYQENQIEDTVEMFNGSDISIATGDDDMVEQVSDQLNQTNLTTLTGEPAEVASEAVRAEISTWAEIQEDAAGDFEQVIQRQDLQQELDQLTENQEPVNEGENATGINQLVEQAEAAIENGDLLAARFVVSSVESEMSFEDYRSDQGNDPENETDSQPALNLTG